MRRHWLGAAAVAGLAAACSTSPSKGGSPAKGSPVPEPSWVVDPRDPGPARPPTGRSLFDFLVAREVPYPFSALVSAIGGQVARRGADPPLRLVLIPRGRSLQRDAARPDFFRFPRAILAVDGEPAPSPREAGFFLKDRLYLGYQERAGLLEVISYNEAAGRFEFQVVRDYREGGTPRLVYADRALCMACHQNGGPIFARPLWDETNANPATVQRLAAEHRAFYGFPLEPGVDAPYLIDNATDRSNLLSAWQRLWREACGGDDEDAVRCRGELLTAALQYRLGGSRRLGTRSRLARRDWETTLARRSSALWPGGWRVPSADIPNRNPMRRDERTTSAGDSDPALAARDVARGARSDLADLIRRSDVPAELEPLLPRDPLAVWPPPGADEALLARAVAGLSEFLAEADLQRLDDALARFLPGPPPASLRAFASLCTVVASPTDAGLRRLSFACKAPEPNDGAGAHFALTGRVYLEGAAVRRGSVDSVELDGEDEIAELTVVGGLVRADGHGGQLAELRLRQTGGRSPRRATGERILGLGLSWSAAEGRGSIETVDDLGPLRKAIEALARRTTSGETDALARKPFRRARILKELEAELGLPPRAWCCEDAQALPEPTLDAHSPDPGGTAAPPRHQAFLHYCGRCHETAEPFPPNFLHGTPAEVDTNLAQCAERIYFRLEMWQREPARRAKTPMPPENALQGLRVSTTEWPAHPDLRALRDSIGEVLRAEGGGPQRLDALERRGYDDLRACLTPRSP